MRQFSRGPNTLYEIRAGMDPRVFGASFARNSVAMQRGADNIWRQVAANVFRNDHWINGRRTFLYEPIARTNQVSRSWNLTTGWGGIAAVALNAVGIDGIANHATTVTDSDGAAFQNRVFNVAVPNDGNTHIVQFWIKKDEDETRFPQIGANISGGTTAVQWRASLNTRTGAFVGANILNGGTGTVRDDGLWWMVEVILPNNTTGNVTLGLAIYPAARTVINGSDNVAATGSIVVGQAQAILNTSIPLSPIMADGTAQTQQGDLLTIPWAHTPAQTMTMYFRGYDLGVYKVSSGDYLRVGTATGDPRFYIEAYQSTSRLRVFHLNGPGVSSWPTGSVIAHGDRIEGRGVYYADDGSVEGSVRLNGGTEVKAARSGPETVGGAWSNSLLTIAPTAPFAFETIRIVKGAQDMDWMAHDYVEAITADVAEFVHLIHFDFSGGPVYLTTGGQDIDWNGVTWEAVGGLLELGGIEETSDAKGQGVDVRLSGVEQSIVSVLLNNNYRGRPVKIYRGHLHRASGQFIGDPIQLFQGLQLSPYTVEEERTQLGGTVKISTRLSGYFGIERVRGIQSNLISHQHHFPGDTFFQHAASLSNTKIYWGIPAPLNPGSGGQGGGRRRFPDGFTEFE